MKFFEEEQSNKKESRVEQKAKITRFQTTPCIRLLLRAILHHTDKKGPNIMNPSVYFFVNKLSSFDNARSFSKRGLLSEIKKPSFPCIATFSIH